MNPTPDPEQDTEPNATPPPPPRARKLWLAGAGVALVLLAGLLAALFSRSAPAPAPPPEAATPATPAEGRPKALKGDRQVEGQVQDDLGRPLARAVVTVRSLDEPELLPREGRTDDAGRFRFDDLPRHGLSVEVTAEGHDASERVVRAEDKGPLSFVLARQGEVLVVLRDAPGKPVANAEVFLTGVGLWPAARCVADEQGECLIRALPAGQYGARARRERRVAPPSPTVSVVPGERARVELTLEDGAEIRGVVLDAASQRPLGGAQVSVYDVTPGLEAASVSTDAQGFFAFHGLWPGEVRLDVVRPGYAAHSQELTLPVRGPLTLALRGSAAVTGHVVDAQGEPIAGALLSVSTREGLPATATAPTALTRPGELGVTHGPVPKIPLVADQSFALGALAAETDAQGKFEIQGLEPAPVVLRASRPGYAPATLELDDLAPHATRNDVRLVLQRAGRVEGRVTDESGRGIHGVYLAVSSTGQGEQSSVTDESGRFVLQDVLGEVTVRAQPEGRAPVACTVAVKPAEVARCALTLTGSVYELGVRVVDEFGAGLSGALVTLRSAELKRTFALTSQRDGSVMFGDLPQPPYVLTVQRRGYLPVEDQAVATAERELRVTLRRAASLRGSVVDAGGQPVPQAFVSTDQGETTAETDDSGMFVLEDVEPGVLTLWAAHPQAGQASSQEVRARAGDTLYNLRIVLPGRFTGQRGPRVSAREAEAPHESAKTAPPEEARDKPSDYTLEQRGSAVVVTRVAPGGAAAKAGLRAGDIIAAIDGEPVLSAAHARGMLRDPPSTTANLRVLRKDQPIRMRYRRPSL